MVKDLLEENSKVKALQDYTYDNIGTSMIPVGITKSVPPFLRHWTRFEYLSEYVDFWTLGVKSKAKAVGYFALGLATINYFAPGALLMFALAARHQDIGWICNFINTTFGKNRSIVLVD